MNFKNEKELELKIRKDLSHYFQIPQGQKAGKDARNGKRVLPDIVCLPTPYAQRFKFNFSIEVKILKTGQARRCLEQGYWQAFQQLHFANYSDYNLDFALVANQYSYQDPVDEDLINHIYSSMRIFGGMNVGWLSMKKGFPEFWMSRVTEFTNEAGTWSPYRLWSAGDGRPFDDTQLTLRV